MDGILRGLRPYTARDIDGLADLLLEAQATPPVGGVTTDELQSLWARRGIDPLHDINLLPGPGGEPIAYSRASLFRDGSSRVTFDIAVSPTFRCQGIGSALYSLVEERARIYGATHVTCPVYVTPNDPRTESVEFLEHRNFYPDHSFWQMRLDRIDRQPHFSPPPGIRLRTFRTDHAEADADRWAELVWAAFGEIMTGPGVLAQTTEPGASPGGYFFAVDTATGVDVGTARARIDMVGGTRVGYIGTIGVLPDYRGRGIATALISHTLDYFIDRGLSSAVLFVENSNTGARRLYEKLGWRPVYRTQHFWKKLGAVWTGE